METNTPESRRLALDSYVFDGAYDEMFAAPHEVRPHYEQVLDIFSTLSQEELQRRRASVDMAFLNQGITFTVYGQEEGIERIFPYDLVPRIVTAAEWAVVEAGLTQRITALNLFLHDIYNDQKILTDGIIPRDVVFS